MSYGIQRKMVWALALAALASVGTPFSRAQNSNSAEVKGAVTDSTAAAIPGATVQLKNVQTGVVTTTTTNGSGLYDIPSVELGNYSLTVHKDGFGDSVRNGLALSVGVFGLNATLAVGPAAQEVVVTADTPLVQTEDSGQHMTFDTKAVQDAPIVGGVWYNELTNELPGVNGGGSQDASGQGIGVNGTQGYSGSFLIEGATAQQPRDANASDNYPPIDAIGEVNVQTANFGSQYSNGVATFNVLLKSGTNRFHGSAFEFIQNDAFNARNYFNNTGPIAPIRWNEFGGSVGGPILRDKLFFYFTFQTNPNSSSSTQFLTVPTNGSFGDANMLAGCFPIDPTGKIPPVKNPATGQPYANNCITGALDPVALNIQKYFPAPNLPGYTNNYQVTQTFPSTSQWYVGKVDYVPAKSHRINASYFDYPISLTNNVDAFCSLGFDCTKGNNYNRDGQITDVWTINSSTVNEARIGGVRESDQYTPPTYDKGYPTTIGLEPAYGSNAPADIFPNITIAAGGGISGIGISGGVHAALEDGALAESDIFTLIKGRHTIKLGGEFQKSYQNYTSWGDVSSGNFSFNGVVTDTPYADFLLGDVQTWSVYDYVETGARSKSGGAFIQDDFQAGKHLTVNVGLRYNYQGGWGEVQNRWGTFSPTVVNSSQYVKPGTLGAISYGGQFGRNTIQNSANEFAPRIGFAFAPSEKTSIRASYGITDVPWSADPYSGAYGVGLNPQGYQSSSTGAVFQLKNGPVANSVVYPSLANLSNSQFNYQNVSYYPASRPITYYQETLLSVQHEIPFQTLVDVSYVFTKGTHLGFSRDINAVPIASQTPTSDCFSGTTAFPQFCSIDGVLYDGSSNYNALQVRVEKRLSHGLSYIFNYAYAKTLDTGTGSGSDAGIDSWQNAFNTSANYGLSKLDVRHTINGSATYELPFGSGRSFRLHGFVDEIFGGYRTTAVYQIHSGIPFTVTATNNGIDNSGVGASTSCYCGFAWYANQVGNPKVSHANFHAGTMGDTWFNTAAFAVPTGGTLGNATRNSLIGPAWRNVDLSVGKTFQLPEKVRLEIRADVSNALNHPNFGQPNGQIGSGAGSGEGTINSASQARFLQLGGRFNF
jgi:hypothetical protein